MSANTSHMVRVPAPQDLQQWLRTCRYLVSQQLAPEQLLFDEADGGMDLLGDSAPMVEVEDAPKFNVPRAYIEIVPKVFCHRSAERLPLLYRTLWRIQKCKRALMDIVTDEDVHALLMMQKAVKRDLHKMHAFVRFRKHVREDGVEHFIAWHKPDHRIVREAAEFFVARFSIMHWSILTPELKCPLETLSS